MAREVTLAQRWTLGKRIGDESGFGSVFEAKAEDGAVGVVKMIPKRPGADRELLFEDLDGVPHVVPVLERGETDEEWLMAMPRAEGSLRSYIDAAGGKLSVDEAVPIVIEVARALAALDGRVVHRDLKPENVLRLGGAWALADFGIARYAEASTAPETWKGAISPPYAAPERWRYEHATSATDVYSFGVMAYELLAGEPPFPGPTAEEFRDQHLHRDAPTLGAVPPALGSLVTECLFKAADARPSPANLLERLERVLAPPSSSGAERLQAANQRIRQVEAEEQALASVAMSEQERRLALLDAARASLKLVAGQLKQAIVDNAPAAAVPLSAPMDDWALKLGDAVIGMDPVTLSDPGSWGRWKPDFDVVAFASVGIAIPADRHGYQGRAHTLFYCDAQEEGRYRWFETAFMVTPLMPQRTAMDPIMLPPGENSGKALSRTLAEWQVAWPFTPIDQGEEEEFIGRWLEWFGAAAAGELSHPSSMPERQPAGSYRN